MPPQGWFEFRAETDIVTGADVIERLRKEYRGTFAPEEDDALVFDSLEKK